MIKNKTKYLGIGTIIIILISISFIGVNLFKSKPKEENEKTISREETKSMLSYTIDGQKTDIKPTKEDGYIANKIICENGSNLIWDNTNWEVEIISIESNDVCSVDFTTNANTNGYRVTVTTNVEGSIDSLSKATIENGTIIFYPNKGQEITGVSGCTGIIENNKVIVSNLTSNQSCNINVKLPIKNLYTLLSDGSKYEVGTRTDFSTPFGGTTITQGYNQTGKIYLSENNYYFAGNPSDNWVKFADKWWRIIRSNNTEGTRLLYAGTIPDGQDGYINNKTYSWNINTSESYVRWNNSIFKDTLSSWYTNNITEKNDSMIENIVYCNDTSYTDMSSSWGTNGKSYGAYDRLAISKSPSYACKINSFGVASKVGMMTADEVVYAGGVYSEGINAPNIYFYRNSKASECTGSKEDPCSITGNYNWWTMSPAQFNGTAKIFQMHGASSSINLFIAGVNNLDVVRPVITLLPTVKVSGSGTTDDPFIPSLD